MAVVVVGAGGKGLTERPGLVHPVGQDVAAVEVEVEEKTDEGFGGQFLLYGY